jgi:hypothetical protein
MLPEKGREFVNSSSEFLELLHFGGKDFLPCIVNILMTPMKEESF